MPIIESLSLMEPLYLSAVSDAAVSVTMKPRDGLGMRNQGDSSGLEVVGGDWSGRRGRVLRFLI
jgi:hypothetical protein